MNDQRYVAVTACKNEETTIGNCVRSVLGQTIKPAAYVVIDDGSTDGTPWILEAFKPRIEVISLEAGRAKTRGNHLRNLFLLAVGYASELMPDWSILLSVDADEVLFPDYVESLIRRMEDDPRLGMTSGIPISRTVGGYRKIHRASNNVWNGARLYRRACWEDIKEIPSIQGWDMWVQFEANRLGWRTRPFDGVNFLEERAWGGASLMFWIRRGFTRRLLGYSWLTHLLTCVTAVAQRPYIVGAVAFFLSYLLYGLGRREFFSPEYHVFVKGHTLDIARGWLRVSKLKEKLRGVSA
ncbi:hypothetical protein AC482_06965 [miscellaneous Crenarchaeota group-15 archaeon DG-45]|uniref:Glycosyltransferase 2-like domain-containing protein n=1 Tax=miscellaneous Crenarchaeota group-15 archaeon DG-45 TaxID=1685127 RepID=A0A0M0BL44_9ARCH|nr:MAG: hypothetical protein AC482_06965 [miscellaneous Crenarchaeota group-15 archaeon DG-45]